jgi:hypothetical protein
MRLEDERSLSTVFFSKEFPSNWEVEWKANLHTEYPLGFIDTVRTASSQRKLEPFCEATYMGEMKTGLQYQHLLFHYYVSHLRGGHHTIPDRSI